MREIKFRLWSKHYNRMITDEVDCHAGFRSDGLVICSIDDVLMQDTRLKDKNGKEIYEGDVVYLAGYGDYVCEFPFLELYHAQWENDIGEIKGNIYQNPELI
jgi:uncharacterized phage protein (TIGR01671 family)